MATLEKYLNDKAESPSKQDLLEEESMLGAGANGAEKP
jgi:hypothetical protein